ncbi:hypothetical protein BBJ28_00006990 [Nothophytophthora sp. Chile5]|nr:hypothetical protein BBJ28_00006990 [Nothophytophthora sp. Chile5]
MTVRNADTPTTGSGAEDSAPLTGLRLLKSRVQTGERHRQLLREEESAAKKIELSAPGPDPAHEEPTELKKTKPRHKKRNFFQWLFLSDVPTNRKVRPPPSKTRVKIPVPYRKGEHKGVIVGGRRVPFSRVMQANRREKLLLQNDCNCAIPEEKEVMLDFPARLARVEYEAEQQRLEDEKKKKKEAALVSELAA